LLGRQRLENYGRDRREILPQLLKLVVPDTFAADRPEFAMRRSECRLKCRGKRRILGRNDKVCIRLSRVAQKGPKLCICQCPVTAANTRAADFNVALGLHQQGRIVPLIRNQNVEDRRGKSFRGQDLSDCNGLHAITTLRSHNDYVKRLYRLNTVPASQSFVSNAAAVLIPVLIVLKNLSRSMS